MLLYCYNGIHYSSVGVKLLTSYFSHAQLMTMNELSVGIGITITAYGWEDTSQHYYMLSPHGACDVHISKQQAAEV